MLARPAPPPLLPAGSPQLPRALAVGRQQDATLARSLSAIDSLPMALESAAEAELASLIDALIDPHEPQLRLPSPASSDS